MRPAFNRDNILTPEERATSARKCINLLAQVDQSQISSKDLPFLLNQRQFSRNIRYAPSELELQWLRDLVERYVTR